jgi:hypothetical protein
VELTIDLNEPFVGSSGGSVSGPIPPDRIALDSRVYLLDTLSKEYRREGIEVLQQRNTSNNRDTLLLPQEIWRQQSESWHQGAGQRNLDRDDALPYRFYRSFGVDPWTKYQFSLLNESTQIHALATDDPCFLHVHNGALVVVNGTDTEWFSDADTSVTLAAGGSSIAISSTYDGDRVITLADDGSVKQFSDNVTVTTRTVTPPGGGNAVSEATFIAYVKDYLIMGVGNEIWDITATAAVLIYTSPVSGFTWKGAAEGQNAIYLIGGAGERHVVHRVGIKSDGTGLEPAVVAATLPDGESGVSIGSYLGYVFVGTDKGVRMATPSGSNGDLVLGALIPLDQPVYGFEGQDRFVWLTASEIDSAPTSETDIRPEIPASPVCGLYRMDLTSFTVTESTPAYATDLFAADQTGKTVRSVVTWNGTRVFAVDDGGVYLEGSDKVPGGWLEMGRVSYSVEDLKTGLYAQAKWEPLSGTVGISLSYDNEAPTRVMNWAIAGSVRSGNIGLDGKQFSRVDPRVDLLRDTDPELGPVFTRLEIRSRAVKGNASRWYLPIMNYESIDFNGVPEARDPVVEFNLLMDIMETGRMVSLQEMSTTHRVVARDFKWVPEKLTTQGTGWQGVFLLIVEEVT